MAIEHRRSKRLRVIFYSLIIRVSKINEVFGSVDDFGEKHNITGVTNGELLVIYSMSYPGELLDYLVDNVFIPNGFSEGKDYDLVEEELAIGVRGKPSRGLNRPLSRLSGSSWLGSVAGKKGNLVWCKSRKC